MTECTPSQKIFTYTSFNISALLSIAKSIRKKRCTCDESQRPMGGSFNWAIFLVFEDGVEWVFRPPRTAFGLRKDTAREVLVSGVTTLKYIKQVGSIPVPEIYAFSPNSQNGVGVPYMLMSKAPGVPLSTYQWSDETIGSSPSATLTIAQKQKTMEQLGEMYAHLSNIRCDKTGSMYPQYEEGGKSSYRSYAPEYGDSQAYRTATDRWNDYVAVEAKAESMPNRLDYTSVGQSLQEKIPALVERDRPLVTTCPGATSLPALNITCVLDWAFASFVPPSLLLVLVEPFVRAFVAAHGFDGAVDAPRQLLPSGSVLWAFARLVNLDGLQDYVYFSEFLHHFIGKQHEEEEEEEEAIHLHLRRIKDCEEYQEASRILSAYDEENPRKPDEKHYFTCVGRERFAVSQHLTVMAELNPTFVADRRLWKWIAQYLRERE
ncbi:aminoglycoside phosphotransferase family protein [Aspergillus homomorphus CBS 101889]|uniref:Aminoglycoside phosphotransferase domain-containing protein n=1 Tax=Aspergillus homomorphus (strain CBS 101889) TaxID=1450537 RepID=A0A395HQ39_ASPHC|nr:hypothetical protein BO97DRAFT_458122 [Aspergillus homomorphus CBS 101889]RAL09553.1 hypothetical protein BO97DRAFT_458122 [Aspergillus homomorphus CBS 101889]